MWITYKPVDLLRRVVVAVFNIKVYGFQASRSKDISLEKISQEPFSHLTSRKSVQSSVYQTVDHKPDGLYFLEPESHAWIHRLVTGHICFTCRSGPNLRTLSQMTPTPVQVTPLHRKHRNSLGRMYHGTR